MIHVGTSNGMSYSRKRACSVLKHKHIYTGLATFTQKRTIDMSHNDYGENVGTSNGMSNAVRDIKLKDYSKNF